MKEATSQQSLNSVRNQVAAGKKRRRSQRRGPIGMIEQLEPRVYLTISPPLITGFSTDSNIVGDRITNDNTLTINGTADAGLTVQVYFNGQSQGTTPVGATGQWSFAAGAKPDGIQSVTALARDNLGNTSSLSAAYAITIDTAAPAAPIITGFSIDTGVVGDHITSDTTLTFTGVAESGSTVTLFLGAETLGTIVTAANGTWSFNMPQRPAGNYAVKANATDVAGNTGALSASFSVTVDTTAPAAPVITGFSIDSGVIGDSITNDNTPTLTGTAEANSSITIFLNGVSQGSTVVLPDGTWSFTAAPLDGTYQVTATAQDAAGNIGPVSAPLPLTIDTTPPAAPTITGFSADSGVPGDGITNDNTLTLTGTSEPGSKVTISCDGSPEGSTTAAADGSWSFDMGAKPNGPHEITAVAQDVAGNNSTPSSTLTVTIDNLAPPPPTITGFSTDTGIAGDRITSDQTLEVTGTAGANSVVIVSFTGQSQGTTTAGANGTWTFQAAQKADGVYSITATAQDVAGNTSAASGALVVTIDTTSPSTPTITGFSSDTGTVGDQLTADNTLTITGTAEPNSTVTVLFNGVSQGVTQTSSNGTWSFDAPAVADGVYAITAFAKDAAGNTSPTTGPLTVTVDATAPSAPTITSFADDTGIPSDRITSDTTLTINGTAEAGSVVNVSFNGVSQGTVVATGTGTWTFTAQSKPDGVYAITATAQDAAGNSSPASNTLSVTIDTVSTTAPTITGFATDTGTVGDNITTDDTLAVTGTAEAGSTVTVLFNGTAVGSTTANAAGNWTFQAPSRPDGVYSITATAQDGAGNVSPPSLPLSVTIDTISPAAPVFTSLSIDSGIPGDKITNDNTLTIAGMAEAGSTVTIRVAGVSQGTTVAGSDGTWTFNLPQKPDGQYSITATAQDKAGNTSAASSPCVVTIDTAAPAAPVITGFSTDSGVLGDKITNDNTLTVTGTAEPGSTVTVFFNGTSQGTTLVGANGSWSFTAGAKPDGVYAITATTSDVAGNTSPVSNDYVVTIDTTPPPAPVITGFATDSSIAGDKITNDNTLLLTGTAPAGSVVTLLFNGAAQGTATALADGSWSFQAGPKPDGQYTITATISDVAGNLSQASNPCVVTIDSTAPTAPSITGFSTDSGVVGDRITNDDTLTVFGTAEPLSKVKVLFNGIQQGTADTGSDGNWSMTAPPQPDGQYTITATAHDVAGNASPASAPLVVTIDTVAPAAPAITAFTDDTGTVGDFLTADNTLTITGTAQAGSVVTVFFNGASQGTTTTSSGGTWSVTSGIVPDGQYAITANARDAAGNTSPASNPLNVTIDTVTAGPPIITSVSDDSGVPGDKITNDTTLTIRGTAEPRSTVTMFFNGIAQGTAAADANGNWLFQAGPQPNGVYTITSTYKDAAGNVSPPSEPCTFTIDATSPNPPVIAGFSSDSGVQGDRITNDSTLTVTGSAEPNSTVTVYFNGASLGTTATDPSGSWTYGAPAKSDGIYTITATAQDKAGNTSASSNSLVVTIDTVAPALPTITGFSIDSGVAGDRVTNDNTLVVQGTAEPFSTVNVSFNGASIGTATTAANGTWSLNAPQKPDGVYSVVATASDAAGNTSSPSTPLDVTIDTSAPAMPFVTLAEEGVWRGSAPLGTVVTAYVNGLARGTSQVATDGSWSIPLQTSPSDVVTFDDHDLAGNRSPESSLALESQGSCGSPTMDLDFNSISGQGNTNRLLMVRERGYALSPDLSLYGALGQHTYVQSLLFHTRDNEHDTEVTAATVTFSPGTVILTTITSSKLLGGTKSDSRATYSDAIFGIFDPNVRSADWNKYSSKPRGLEGKDNRFEVVNDGRNGKPAVLEIEFPTRVGPDQGRVIVDYGNCWGSSDVEITFHSERARSRYPRYQGVILGGIDLGDNAKTSVSLFVQPTTIDSLSVDNGPSTADRVTTDTTPLISGKSRAGATVKLYLNGNYVDKVLADDQGRWSYLFPELSPGNYRLRGVGEEAGVQIGSSPLFGFTISTL